MILFKKFPLRFEEKDYQIRVLYDEKTINVVAFLHNYPVNGLRHQIKVPGKCDVQAALAKGVAAGLVEMTKEDIIHHRWQGIQEILSRNTLTG
jgi:hypothetical protein